MPTAWRLSAPDTGMRDVTVRAGRAAMCKVFALTQKVLIAGTVYLDANSNGLRDEGEVGMRNRKVFIDLNGDALWQPNEKSVRSNTLGQWTFRDRDPGTHRIGLVPKIGYIRITPPGGLWHVTLANGGDKETNVLFAEARIV